MEKTRLNTGEDSMYRTKMTKIKMLIVLVAFGLGAMITYGNLVSAQTSDKELLNVTGTIDFLDPFTLTTLTMGPPADSRSTTPILTLRQWVHVPYRPPVRSPYQPGI